MSSSAVKQRFGPYIATDVLGRGAMATVYRAVRADGSGLPVAIKCMHRHLIDNDEARVMFEHEAKTLGAIQHPNVCGLRSYDPGALFGSGGDQPAMVLELVHGVQLSTVLKEISDGNALTHLGVDLGAIFLQLCDALDAVHEASDEDGRSLGIVHRDVSPENVLVDADGLATLIDFGVAYSRRMTSTGTQRGRASYSAPEQLEGQPFDRRVDVWSLGVLMYEALCGQNPFLRASEPATFHAVMTSPVPPPSTHLSLEERKAVEPFDSIVLSALERDPAKRVSSMTNLAMLIKVEARGT